MSLDSAKIRFVKRANDIGSYWIAPSTGKTQLHSCLHSLNGGMFKVADLGGDQESNFEQAFSSLAYAYLKDKAPRLLDFIVGFQLIDRNEDNTKAVGIFGFKVGDQWLYAPCFFLNGDLKGHELLYIKKQDTFVPMKENWVNYLIARKPHALGEGSQQTTHQLGGLMPNMMRLARPPIGTKYGEDEETARAEAQKSFLPHIRAGMYRCAGCASKYYTKKKAESCCGKGMITARGLKQAAAEPLRPQVADWAVPFVPFAVSLMLKQAKALYPEHVKTASDVALNFRAVVNSPFQAALAPYAQKFDMRNFLGEFPMLKAAFEKCYLKYPLVKKGFDRFYGPNFFREMAQMQKQVLDNLVSRAQRDGFYKAAKESYVVPPKKKQKYPGSLIAEEERCKEAGLLVFVTDSEGNIYKHAKELDVDEDAVGTVTDNLTELTDEERKRLLKDTVLIKDKRDPHGKSMAYNTQVRLDLANPDQTGLFDVLEKPGKFDDMVVLVNPYTGQGESNFCTVIRKNDSRAWKNLDRNSLFVKQNRQPTQTDFKEWVKGLDGIKSLKKGGTYVALDENGGATAPFTVREDFGDGNYRVDWDDNIAWSDRSNRRTSQMYDLDEDSDYRYSSWDAKVWINQREGCKLRAVRGELSIPSDFKILKLKDPPKPPKSENRFSLLRPPPGMQGESCEAPIMPGNIKDVQMLLQKEAHQLKITDAGNEVWIKSANGDERMTKKAALLTLVRDHGLDEVQARIMLKEAAACAVRMKPALFFVKYADGYPSLQPGPTSPAIPEPMRGTEMNGYNSVASIYPQEEFMPVDEMSAHQTDPTIYDPFYQPDDQAMQVAQQAGQQGQKEVFDTAMISGMLKSVQQNDRVDKYLGDLMKALDKLGRIIFLFFWHQEEFEDRYGKAQLPELEDSLRNAFDVLGDVVLFLKEKTVEGQHAMDISGSVGSGRPDPDVTEAARN